MKKFALAWALAFLIGAGSLTGAPARADEVYEIDGEVWDYFQAYLDKISQGQRPGAYAITTDGHGAYYVWCGETRCVAGRTYGQEAKSYCEQAYDADCVVFAVRDEIRVQYKIR